MKMTINILAHLMKADAEKYRREYDEALKLKEDALKRAKEGFIGETLAKEIDRINSEFDAKIVKLKKSATAVLKDLNALKEDEMQQIQGIDKNTIDKINALKDVPMTEDEFIALMGDVRITSNYWAKRSLMAIAEKNNIDVIKTGIGADYATKLNVISQLEDQFTRIIKGYPDADGDITERLCVRRVYLNDNVIARAIKIFGGELDTRTDEAKADKAYMNIKSHHGDMEQAFAISNALRNANGEANRNRLLYNIATDSKISDLSMQMSGAYDEIMDFRQNKSAEYKKASIAMETIRKANTKDAVVPVLDENKSNKFFLNMYGAEMKRNEYLRSFMNPKGIEETFEKVESESGKE